MWNIDQKWGRLAAASVAPSLGVVRLSCPLDKLLRGAGACLNKNWHRLNKAGTCLNKPTLFNGTVRGKVYEAGLFARYCSMIASPEVLARTTPLYERVRRVIPEIEWPIFAADVDSILRLKRERNAVVLAHNYQTPEIFHCVADFVGDSLALARQAKTVEADTIVLAGVYFMAETAKILNPEKTVLIPNLAAGCSLADSITPEDVRLLRASHPGVPIIAYVNTSAAVKAEADICCTSGNARAIVESLGATRVILLPDEYLARNIASETDVEVLTWAGHCEVHERFTAAEVRQLREDHPGVIVLAHPECPPDVVAEADFSGSTAAMSGYVREKRPPRVVLLTECSMSDNVAVNHPDVDFIRPCNLCPHMKRITLANIRAALEENRHVVTLDPTVAVRARLSVERMLAI